MIDLMAKRPRQQILPANLKRLALRVLRPHRNKLRPHHIPAKPRYGQAPFFLANFPLCVNNLRIGNHNFRFWIFPHGNVNPREPQAQSNLRRRQPHALRRVHRSKHILDQPFQLGIKLLHRCSRFFKDRISVLHDRINLARRPSRRRFRRNRRRSRAPHYFRTRRFVWHSCRNSAASRKGNLLRIFAKKHPQTKENPSPRPHPPPPVPHTSRSAHKPPAPAAWSPCPRYAAPAAASKWVSGSRVRRHLLHS